MAEKRTNWNVRLETLGCKLNQAETERLSRELAASGYKVVSSGEKADIYILNTCTVTGTADQKARQLLRLWHRENPEAVVVATGCYAERQPDILCNIEGVSLVVPNDDKPRLVGILNDFLISSGFPAGHDFSEPDDALRTRSFIRIQDGCSNFCAYCIVPYVRGKEKSRFPEEVIEEIKNRVAGGYQEVVLTGTEIGAYRHNGTVLRDLIRRILDETSIERLRLSSLQPPEITPELLAFWDSPRLCRHFHMSAQSGSEDVLRRMKRRYKVTEYAEAVTHIRRKLPDAAVTTDVIVGFPGETEAEFEESYEFCKRMGFARIHVFPYSSRPGTAAAGMPAQVSVGVKKARSKKMLSLSKDSARVFMEGFIGKRMPVLWEPPEDRVRSGYTGNYIRVYTRSEAASTNQIAEVKLVKLYRDGVWGETA